jgi:pyruvate/2-oxoglutarate dehydrogenase complex dihydrolipoamide acyltransferase (E2) component
MKEYKILPRNKMFELYTILNKENIPEARVIAIREIDLSSIERARKKYVSEQNPNAVKPTYTSFIAKATAKVLREMPHANRSTIESFFFKRVFQFLNTHISVAVERNDSVNNTGGAFVYTIYDTDKKNLVEISQEIAGLASSTLESADPRLDRWRKMMDGVRLIPYAWMIGCLVWFHKNIPSLYVPNRGGAAMISSPSKYGVDFIAAHWPYTLGISFGFAKERPWVEKGEVVVRKTMYITLAFDRRIIPGADGARFMNRLCELLETAETSLADSEPQV